MSRKVHTTRCCARAVINVDKTQLIFLDTPGVVSAKEGLKYLFIFYYCDAIKKANKVAEII